MESRCSSDGLAHLFDPVQQRLEPIPVHLTVAVEESQSGALGNISTPDPRPDQTCSGDKRQEGAPVTPSSRKPMVESHNIPCTPPNMHTYNSSPPHTPRSSLAAQTYLAAGYCVSISPWAT